MDSGELEFKQWLEENQWQLQGLCREKPYYRHYFFPETPTDPLIPTAKRICANCEVQPECAAYAWRAREPFGIWGGVDEWERRRALVLYDALNAPPPPPEQEGYTFDLLGPDLPAEMTTGTGHLDGGDEGFVFFLAV